jgi:hypothetical protein
MNRIHAAIAVAVLSAVLAAPGVEAAAFASRVYYDQISDISRLDGYDVWEFNDTKQRFVLVSMDETILDELRSAGWRVERDALATAMLSPDVRFGRGDSFSGGYRTVAELQADMASINAAHPGLTEVVDYGDSFCKQAGGCTTPGSDFNPGWDLRAIRVTNEALPGPKPVFFLIANIHAREITTPELAMNMLDWLVNGYGVDADATWIVDHHEVWIVPTVNPDGHWLVELGNLPQYGSTPFFQRKNGNALNVCTTWPPNTFSQYGVDLNRNHSFGWGTGGSTNQTCDQTYKGTAAASEPEVAQLETLIKAHIADQRGPGINDVAPLSTQGILITLHSYSELVLWPWGNTTNPAPNMSGLKAIGDKLATYNGYTSCQPPLCLYVVSGTSDDFAYGTLGIPAFTIEVGTQFMPPFSQIASIQWPGNGPALQYAAKIARQPYKLSGGPDALNLVAVKNGTNVTISGVIDDQKNGNNPVRKAAYFIDTPYWKGGTLTLMQAVDGSFNTSTEAVTATFSTIGLTPGQHIVFVHGRDSLKNFGPASAVFFTVP